MPYYLPKTKYRKAYPPDFRNGFWEKWGPLGKLIGYPQIVLGLTLTVVEIVRILYGPTHRGMTNYDTNDNNAFSSNDDSLLLKIRDGNILKLTYRAEKFHYWPWTYAANLFGTVVITSGISGIISAYRRSYTSIFAFLTLSLLSAIFSGYLISYYSILLNYYIRRGLSNPTYNIPDTIDTSFGLIGTNLAFSCASCLFGLFGLIAGFLGIRAGTPKGFESYGNIVKDIIINNNGELPTKTPKNKQEKNNKNNNQQRPSSPQPLNNNRPSSPQPIYNNRPPSPQPLYYNRPPSPLLTQNNYYPYYNSPSAYYRPSPSRQYPQPVIARR